jgi:hypothetical protein
MKNGVPCGTPFSLIKKAAQRPRAKEGGREEEEKRPGISPERSLRNTKPDVSVTERRPDGFLQGLSLCIERWRFSAAVRHRFQRRLTIAVPAVTAINATISRRVTGSPSSATPDSRPEIGVSSVNVASGVAG